jgi:hypothetical protein
MPMRVYRSNHYLQAGAGFNRHLDNVQVYPYDQYYNRGDGVGSIFRSLYSTVVPLVKSAFRIGKKALATPVGQAVKKAAKRTAMRAGLNVVNDALAGENIIKSTKKQLKSAPATFVEEMKKNKPGSSGGNAACIKSKPFNTTVVAATQISSKKKKRKKKKQAVAAMAGMGVKSKSLKQFIAKLQKKGRAPYPIALTTKPAGSGKKRGGKKKKKKKKTMTTRKANGSGRGKKKKKKKKQGRRVKADLFD